MADYAQVFDVGNLVVTVHGTDIETFEPRKVVFLECHFNHCSTSVMGAMKGFVLIVNRKQVLTDM